MQTNTTKSKTTKLEDILDIAKKNGATQIEVIQTNWTDNPISFENNILKSLESNEHAGIAIRLIKNNKIGISSSTDLEALEMVVNSAIEASMFGPEATFDFTTQKIDINENRQAKPELPLEKLVEKGTQVIAELKTFHKDLLVSGGFDLGFGETLYINSNGVYGKRAKTIYSTSFYAHLVRGEDFLGIYDGRSCLDAFPNENEIKEKILAKLNYSKEMVPLRTKKYSVIFTPRAVGSIFAYILTVLLNGKAIQQGISPLVKKIGEELFDKKFSFIENPEIGTGRALFDDEGIKTKKKVLIKNGIVNSFYFDLSSGSKMNPKYASTGNGFKGGLSSSPSPDLTSLEIDAGKKSYTALIKQTNEGILVDQLLGAGQSNTLAGEFNVGIDLGFKIENGEIKGRIKNSMIAGNIFDLLKNISEISCDREWAGGSQLFPAFLMEDITVAGKQN